VLKINIYLIVVASLLIGGMIGSLVEQYRFHSAIEAK